MDPRIILKEKLYSIGISFKDSTIIALDAGSSQISIDKEYFEDYKYTEDIIEKSISLILNFYEGELIAD